MIDENIWPSRIADENGDDNGGENGGENGGGSRDPDDPEPDDWY